MSPLNSYTVITTGGHQGVNRTDSLNVVTYEKDIGTLENTKFKCMKYLRLYPDHTDAVQNVCYMFPDSESSPPPARSNIITPL